ncbi:HAD-IA family hydrolase [Streptomyces avermitilis]
MAVRRGGRPRQYLWIEGAGRCGCSRLDRTPPAIGVAKPDPRVYRIASERVGASAERCLFIDETEANVTAARGARNGRPPLPRPCGTARDAHAAVQPVAGAGGPGVWGGWLG